MLGFLTVIALITVFRIGSIFYDNAKGSKTANISASLPKSPASINALTIDTDHDGFPDRDEILYATNPYKPDTDGDGYLDGEEITTGHDPLDATSNDKTGSGSVLGSNSPNLTDRAINLAVASLIGDDGELDPSRASPDSATTVAQSIQVQAALSLFVEPIADTALNITTDNSPEAVKKYLDAVLPIVEGNLLNPARNLQGTSFSSDSAFDYYKKAFQALSLLEVPSTWKNVHKNTLNLLQTIIKSSESLTDQAIQDDPIKASYALKQLSDSFAQFHSILTQASLLAKSQNISTTDPIFELLTK